MLIAVILGNRLNDDGSTTKLMDKRIELAKKIDEELAPDFIIVSGGLANAKANRTEADVMKERLVAMGVDESKLIKEEESLTTTQNAIFSAKIIKEKQCDCVVVCTTYEHMYRWYGNPLKLFKRQLGKDVYVEGYCNAPEENDGLQEIG